MNDVNEGDVYEDLLWVLKQAQDDVVLVRNNVAFVHDDVNFVYQNSKLLTSSVYCELNQSPFVLSNAKCVSKYEVRSILGGNFRIATQKLKLRYWGGDSEITSQDAVPQPWYFNFNLSKYHIPIIQV